MTHHPPEPTTPHPPRFHTLQRLTLIVLFLAVPTTALRLEWSRRVRAAIESELAALRANDER